MTSSNAWQLILCPVCKGKDLSFRETRNVSVYFRQRPHRVPVEAAFRVIKESAEGSLYEYDSQTDFLEDVQARCHTCGLKWVLSECKHVEDLDSAPPLPTPKKAARTIKADGLVRDIVAGMTDPELMSKYHLTARQLEVLLQHLVHRGLVTQKQIDERLNLADTAITRAFEETRRSIEELDYHHAATETSREKPPTSREPVDREIPPQAVRSIEVYDFVADVLAGMSDEEFLVKYSLNPKQLEFVFQRLLDLGYVTAEELCNRASLTDTSITRSLVDVYQALRALED